MTTGNQLQAVITVDAKNAAFTIDKFVGQTVGGMGQAATASKGATSAFSGLGGAAVVLNQGLQLVQTAGRLAVAAFDLLVGGAQRTGEQYLLLSQQTGLTVEQISALSVAAGTADVSNEALALSIKKLNINMVDAAQGGKESTATFKALGVETKNADGSLRDVNEVFLDTIDALGAITNDSERAAASQAVFGRSSQELAALIADGSGKIREQAELAAKLGLVWSGPAAQAADELGDQTTVLKMGLKGISDEIGSKSIPSMTELVSSTNDWIVKNREAISLNIDRIFAAVGAAADVTSGAIHGVAESVSALLHLAPGLSEWLSTVKGLTVEWLDLNVQAREAAKSTNDAGRAFIDQAGKVREAKSALDQYVAGLGDSNELTADQARALTELRDTYREEQAELDRLNGALTDHVDKTEQAASANDFLVQSLSTLKDKASLGAAAQAQFAKQTGLTLEEVKRLDAGLKPTPEQIEKIAAATHKTAEEITKALPGTRSFADGMKKDGDEAEKAAEKAAQLADKLASVSATSADYLTQQIALAGETGDLTAIQEASAAATQAVEKAFRDAKTAIEADAAAGANQALVAAEQTRAEQQHEDGLRKVAVATAAATVATKGYEATLQQVDLAALSLEASQAAREIQQLARAGVGGAVVNKAFENATTSLNAAFAKQVDAIKAEADAQRAGLDPQRDAIKLQVIDAVAKQKGAEATDQYVQALQGLLDQLDALASEDPLDALKRRTERQVGDVQKSLKGLLEGDGSFGDFVTELKDLLTGSNGPGAIIDSMGSSVVSGLMDILREVANFGSNITNALVHDITDPIVGGLQHLESEIVDEIENLAEGAWDAITDFFGGGTPQSEKIARAMSKTLRGALESDAVAGTIDAGLEALGFQLTRGLEQTIANAPMNGDVFMDAIARGLDVTQLSPALQASLKKVGKGVASQTIQDVVLAVFPEVDAAGRTEISQLAKSWAAEMAKAGGKTGKEALAFAENLGAGMLEALDQAGLSKEQVEAFFAASLSGLDISPAFIPALDRLNADLMTQGVAPFDSMLDAINGKLSEVTGTKIDAGNLTDIFVQASAAGLDEVSTLNYVKQALAEVGVDVTQLGDDWVQAFAAAQGASAAAIDDILGDFGRLSSDASAASGLINELGGELSNLGKSMAGGGFSSDELSVVAAELQKIATLPPDALQGMSGSIHGLFVEIARANDLTLPQVVDMFRGQIPDAVLDSILAVKDLGLELGKLSGASNASLSDVVADFARFAGQIRDAEGELTSMGKVLVDQTRAAIGGMQSAILEDSQVTLDEARKVFEQLALIPAEALSDPSVKAAYDEIISNLLAGTDTASIDELKAQIAAMPPTEPPVDPGVTKDAKVATDDLTASIQNLQGQAQLLAAGPSVTDALGLTPEAAAAMAGVTDSLTAALGASTDLGGSVQDLASGVTASTDQFATLAQAAGLSSQQVQAAIQPIIGVVGDGRSLTDMTDVIGRAVPEALDQATQVVLGSTGTWHDSFDYSRGAVIMLHDELTALAGNYEVTVTTRYVTEGEPPPGEDGGGEGHAAGHWTVPGPVGAPYRTTVHGGEEVLSVEQSRDYRRTMREAALDGLSVHDGAPVVAWAPSAPASGPTVDEVAQRVVQRLTDSGALQLLQLPVVDAHRLAKAVLVENADEAFRSGALTGARIKRNVARPT